MNQPLRRPSLRRRVLTAFLRQWALILVGLLLLVMPPILHQRADKAPRKKLLPRGEDPDRPAPRPPQLAKLRQALATGDVKAVLDFFHTQALTDEERTAVRRQIGRLGEESFAARQKATDSLAAWGSRAAALLRQARRHPDPETAGRAAACLTQALQGSDPPLLLSAVQLLAQRRPAGTAAVLLEYLPDAEDEGTADAIRNALAALAVRDGHTDEAVVKALADPLPERRAAAAVALCQLAAASHRPAVRKLLKDADPEVRRRVALALVSLPEKQAVPVLVELLAALPREQAWPVLELLDDLAGADAPVTVAGRNAAERGQCRDAWAAWWKEKGNRLDLARALSQAEKRRPKGNTLLVQLGLGSFSGQVVELGSDQVPPWQINDLDYPLSAQVLPGDRVLIAEYHGRLVSERNLQGEILWSKPMDVPVVFAQRLSNGNTFLAARNRVVELDRSGQEVFSHRRQRRDLVAARPCDGGGAVLLTDAGVCVFLDAQGKEASRFATGAQQVLGAGFDVLPNKRVLVPHFAGNKVVEYAPDGRVLRQVRAVSPTGVQSLPGGHVLVTSTTTREVVELDRAGKEVWKHATSASPVQALRH